MLTAIGIVLAGASASGLVWDWIRHRDDVTEPD